MIPQGIHPVIDKTTMTVFQKFVERFKLGFTISDPMSRRGKEILENDWNAGYDIIEAVLESDMHGSKKDRVLAERISLANKEYDLIQA